MATPKGSGGPSNTRGQILELLQRSGNGLTADALAHKLGISAVAVRKHLAAFERDNLVATELERRPMGRPTYLYRPTASAQELFPNDYANLATAVLEMIRLRDGEHKVDELFQHRQPALLAGVHPPLSAQHRQSERPGHFLIIHALHVSARQPQAAHIVNFVPCKDEGVRRVYQ